MSNDPSRRFTRDELIAAKGERFSHPLQVRFQDVDAAGVVFFARFFDYFHDAYVAFLEQAQLPLPRVLEARSWAAPLVHAEADYLKPLRFGDRVEAQLVLAEVGSSSILLGHRVVKAGAASAVAIGQTVHAFIDPAARSRIEVPPDVAAAFRRLSA